MFPHHENVIAIARALTGKPAAKYWLHCERTLLDNKEVAEKGKGLSLRDLIDMGYSGREVRYWLIASHYRKPITFSRDRLENARRALKRIDACIQGLLRVKAGRTYSELNQLLYDIKNGFTAGMDDDLNISAAMASVFKIIKQINILILNKDINPADAAKIIEALRGINQVLNIFELDHEYSDPDIQQLLKERQKARAAKNWSEADKFRDQLRARGVVVRDHKV
jgi:cysteinyl-tRNA synthetase